MNMVRKKDQIFCHQIFMYNARAKDNLFICVIVKKIPTTLFLQLDGALKKEFHTGR